MQQIQRRSFLSCLLIPLLYRKPQKSLKEIDKDFYEIYKWEQVGYTCSTGIRQGKTYLQMKNEKRTLLYVCEDNPFLIYSKCEVLKQIKGMVEDLVLNKRIYEHKYRPFEHFRYKHHSKWTLSYESERFDLYMNRKKGFWEGNFNQNGANCVN